MSLGTFYGMGVGPGDPELLTVKAAGVLGRCPHVVVPKAKAEGDSVALEIAKRYVHDGAEVHELVFPMTMDKAELARKWRLAAETVAGLLRTGQDVCFLTLGDALVYSTYIYLLRELKALLPELEVVTVPGITSFSAVAALTDFPLGEGKEPITVVPTADDLGAVRRAIETGGTVVLMKIGKRLGDILDILEETGVIGRSVFVQRAGHPTQLIERDLRKLRAAQAEAGYLSVILIHTNPKQP
ncbi:MAG: precorrin-2 C(20)-methyltransferase [Verrucomicrobiales bacterium]|nr:precorrin-2 C(20)-methyltransferase [Verrucomicrobiota bacterium JB025]